MVSSQSVPSRQSPTGMPRVIIESNHHAFLAYKNSLSFRYGERGVIVGVQALHKKGFLPVTLLGVEQRLGLSARASSQALKSVHCCLAGIT